MSGPSRPPAKGRQSNAGSGTEAALLSEAVRRHRAGDLTGAAAGYRQVLSRAPSQPDALHLLGVVAHQQGDQRRAAQLIGKALERAGDNPAFRNSLGNVLLAQGKAAEAEAVFRRSLAVDDGAAETHNNLGNALVQQGRPADAVACYRRAIGLRPGYVEAHSNLGSACQRLGRLDEAEAALDAALARSPRHVSALSNLGLVRHDQARYADALEAYDRALAIHPDHATARANRAVLLLLLGRFDEGWREYEWRWRVPGFASTPRTFAAPPWTGKPLDRGTLFIHAEQGLGSAIQFVRYVPLAARICRRVVVEVPAPLERLFRTSLAASGDGAAGNAVDVIVRGAPIPKADARAAMMSLPALFGTTVDTVPADVPYLRSTETDADRWRRDLAQAARPRVGLVWAGNPDHRNDHNRSMPAAALAPLIQGGAGSFFSLQVDKQRQGLPEGFPRDRVRDLSPGLNDFADTAAAVDALDLVISVDTAVAHLAGALGRPVWLMLPYVPEWRWLLDRTDTPWYPTMRLFRQAAPADWGSVVDALGAALSALPRG